MSTTTTGPSSTTTSSSTTSSTTTTPPGITLPFPPTTTTSTSTSTTSSSSSTTATSSTSTNTSTTSTTTSTTTASTAVAVPPTQANSTTSTGIPAVITEVSTTFVSQSQSNAPTAAVVKNTAGNAFFQNKGAVAGVFSVVGLIGLVILVALIMNIIRRREARRFDKELSEATRQAASMPIPDFLDGELEEDDPKHNNGYSEGSHGTYSQPQMDVFRGPAVGEYYPPYPGNGAGIGARGAHYDPYAAPFQGGSPYPPFPMARDPYGDPPGRSNEHAAAIIPTGQQYPQRSPPPDLGRSKSTSTAITDPSHASNYSQPSYSVGEKIANFPNPHNDEEHLSRRVEPQGESADDAAYGGYVEDDVEEEVPKRVLKIANES